MHLHNFIKVAMKTNIFSISVIQRFPNFNTLRPPPQDFALIYAPSPREKTHKILYMEHK
jgi:hypothetical protein